MAFKPGNQHSKGKGRPKSAFKDGFDQLKAKKKMHEEATQILSERWVDVFNAMCDLAEDGNTQAAVFVTNYVLGKPKESIELDIGGKAEIGITISKEENGL